MAVYRMEFNKIKNMWNSDQNCTHVGVLGWGWPKVGISGLWAEGRGINSFSFYLMQLCNTERGFIWNSQHTSLPHPPTHPWTSRYLTVN